MIFLHFHLLLQLFLLGLGLFRDVGLLFQVILCLFKVMLQYRIANGLPREGNTYTTLILGILVLDDKCRLWARLPDDRLFDDWREYTVFVFIFCFNDGNDVDLLRLHDLGSCVARYGSRLLADVRLLLDAYDDKFAGNLIYGHQIAEFGRNDVGTHIDVHDFLLLTLFVFANLRIVGQFQPTFFRGCSELDS